MNAAELLAELARRGIRLEADGERLRYHPRLALTPDLLGRLTAYKSELLQLLRRAPAWDVNAAADAEFIDPNEFSWSHISEVDRKYLLGPRNYPKPCPWCGGRLIHHPLCDELRQSWDPILPFGKHAGKRVPEAPRDYVRWLVRQSGIDGELREAIEHLLKAEATK